MRNFIKLFLCMLVCFFMVSEVQARQIRVAWVPDGDTLILEDREVVRLKGIDAPETGYDGESDQYFAREATQKLQKLVEGRTLRLETGQNPQDRHGRTLGYVYLPNNENVSVIMVREGFAFYYPHPDQDRDISARILSAQKEAMVNGMGFWPAILSMEEAEATYAGNSRSKRFHVLECGYGQRISDANKVIFPSLYEAFYQGYAPCRRCTPWPPAKN